MNTGCFFVVRVLVLIMLLGSAQRLLAAENSVSAAATAAQAKISSINELRAKSDEPGVRDALPGRPLFQQHCAGCHNGSVYKAPHVTWLEMMPASSLYESMNEGVMAMQARHLTKQQRIDIVEYLLQERFDPADTASRDFQYCQGDAAKFNREDPDYNVGWGHDTSRFIPAELARLALDDIPRLKLKWAYAFPAASRARSQPSAGMGAIFVGSQDGTVYAFDLETGCIRWTFAANAEVRTGVVLDSSDKSKPTVFFGDIIANVYAVDALHGTLLWKVRADDHPSATLTGTPAFHDAVLYVPVSSLEVIAAADPAYACCTFRGKVLALNGRTGERLWESHAIPAAPEHVANTSLGTRIMAPSGAPVWASPTIDAKNRRLYFGTGENYSSPADENSDALIAVDLNTGERLWQHQITPNDAWNVACMMADNPNCPEENGPDHDLGASPLLFEQADGRRLLLLGQKSGTVSAHDPQQQGKRLWSTKIGRGSIQGGVHFGMAMENGRLYVPINDMNNTHNGDMLDPEAARPGIHAVDALSGEILWRHVQENVCGQGRPACDPGISAPVTAIPGAVFAGHLDGFLRAYDGESGRIIWEYNTVRDIKTVNDIAGRGGSMSGSGSIVADGHLIMNSGYGLYFHEPGNVLLVFSVDGK